MFGVISQLGGRSDMSKQHDGVLLMFTAKAKPGKEKALRDLFVSVITNSRHDAGNLFYELHEVEGDPASIFLYEWWVSEEHLQAHMESSALLSLKEAVGHLMEGKFEDGQKRLRRLRPKDLAG